ncbi:hypothetical protein HHK36_006516 [Tetracentron sinense]|uniref:Major facilitator superfamily (MFS) profile domain-containing protein n=1 Tax=Tetracentron sinense TaxID=13715 RepID=A0A834ZKM7_TETSI|nr:hypothetical protein HHK36_006516 [Tetracentron sinense]
MPRLGWRWLLALSSLPSFILLLFYGVTPESPRYLCMKGRTNDALVILEKGARLNQSELPSGMLVSDHKIVLDEKHAPLADTILSQTTTSEEKDSKMGVFSSLFMLLSPNLVRSTLLLWVVFFGNAFSYYGLVLLTSELSNGNNKCSPTALHSEKSQNTKLYRDVLITSFAEFPGLLISAATVDRFGRKISMSAMFFLCCVFLLPLVFHQPEILTTGLLFGARICITGTFTIVYIYAPEIYPTSVRATGVGVASSVGRIGGMICPLVAVGLVHGCHQTAAIVLFEIVIFLSGVCVLFFPFETKGRDLSDSVSNSKQVNMVI